MLCKKCNHGCAKNGFQTNGVQRYYCKYCKTHQQNAHTYKAYGLHIDESIYRLIINSCGITDISRVLGIAKNTVSKRILKLANQIERPQYKERQQSYEVDELPYQSGRKALLDKLCHKQVHQTDHELCHWEQEQRKFVQCHKRIAIVKPQTDIYR